MDKDEHYDCTNGKGPGPLKLEGKYRRLKNGNIDGRSLTELKFDDFEVDSCARGVIDKCNQNASFTLIFSNDRIEFPTAKYAREVLNG